MIIPFVPRVTVVNKNIVYGDTVLPLREFGSSLNVSSVSDVSETDLENCLRIIFNANKDVVFNTIQYSRQNKKLYFYTNKSINTKVYEDSKVRKFNPVSTKTEILEEVKELLVSEKSLDPELISLYDVAVLLKVYRSEYEKAKERAESKVKYLASAKISEKSGIYFCSFDYKNKILKVRFKKYRTSDYGDIDFSKNQGDLYVVSATSIYSSEVMEKIGSAISELYDTMLRFETYLDEKESNYNIKTNSNFEASVSHYGAGVYEYDDLEQKFKLFSPSYDNEFSIDCNSNLLMEAFKNNEVELFKRIFVPINECPSWCQDALRERRKLQLIEEDKKAQEEMLREARQQRRSELMEKYFPFLKRK